jgi:hypothetical protein
VQKSDKCDLFVVSFLYQNSAKDYGKYDTYCLDDTCSLFGENLSELWPGQRQSGDYRGDILMT